MKPLRLLYLFSFFLAFSYAATTYINSTYLSQFVGEKNVGLIYAIASVLAIGGLLFLPKWTIRIGNFRIANLILLAMLLSLAGLLFAKTATAAVLFLLVYFATNILIVFSRDVFLEKYSREESTGLTRGILLTAINFGFVFAPALSGFLFEHAFGLVYLLAAILLLPALFIIRPFRGFRDPEYQPPRLAEVWQKFRQDPSVFKIYIVNFILQFFYVWMVVFLPIYLNKYVGFNFTEIGLIFSIMLTAFVILQYPLGRLADKIGEKEMLNIGIVIAAMATLAVPFIQVPNFFLWAAVLFLTRVGAAAIEAMTEIYFFKKVKATDSEVISFYRNTFPVASVIAPLAASGILLFASFETLFIILGFVVFASLFASATLVDTN